jgi:hypothetical protein
MCTTRKAADGHSAFPGAIGRPVVGCSARIAAAGDGGIVLDTLGKARGVGWREPGTLGFGAWRWRVWPRGSTRCPSPPPAHSEAECGRGPGLVSSRRSLPGMWLSTNQRIRTDTRRCRSFRNRRSIRPPLTSPRAFSGWSLSRLINKRKLKYCSGVGRSRSVGRNQRL